MVAYQVWTGGQDGRVMMELRDSPASLVRRVPRENEEQKEFQALRAPRVARATRGSLDCPARMGSKEKWVSQDRRENLDLLAF